MKKRGGRNAQKHFFYGAVAGVVARSCVAPLERLKLLKQVQGSHFPNFWRSFRELVQMQGWRGLWKGNFANVLRIGPAIALRFFLYEILQKRSSKQHILQKALVSGAGAGLSTTILIYPLDLIRTRLTVQTHHTTSLFPYKGIVDAARMIYKTEGIRGFYKGSLMACIRVTPFVGVNFATYEFFRHQMFNLQESGGIAVLLGKGILSGGAAGIIALTTTYPLEVIQRRMMVIPNQTSAQFTILHTTQTIYSQTGLRGFYAGLLPCCLKVTPGNAIKWGTIEMCRRVFGM